MAAGDTCEGKRVRAWRKDLRPGRYAGPIKYDPRPGPVFYA